MTVRELLAKLAHNSEITMDSEVLLVVQPITEDGEEIEAELTDVTVNDDGVVELA